MGRKRQKERQRRARNWRGGEGKKAWSLAHKILNPPLVVKKQTYIHEYVQEII